MTLGESKRTQRDTDFNRRDLLRLGGAAAAGVALSPFTSRTGHAQTPKRGGTINIRAWDPPHFDPHQTISYKTHIAYSFTHSRLLKYKAGPGVTPGSTGRKRGQRRPHGCGAAESKQLAPVDIEVSLGLLRRSHAHDWGPSRASSLTQNVSDGREMWRHSGGKASGSQGGAWPQRPARL